MTFSRQYFYIFDKALRDGIIEVAHELAIEINKAHTKLRAMR